MRKCIAAALYTAWLVPVAGLAQSNVPGTYAEGLALYEHGRYVDAISALAIAGEDGDARAQRLLGMMYLYGERLHGSAVERNPGLALSWLYRASAQGDEVATWTVARIVVAPVPIGPALVRSEAHAR
jgi:TPR repeat protein